MLHIGALGNRCAPRREAVGREIRPQSMCSWMSMQRAAKVQRYDASTRRPKVPRHGIRWHRAPGACKGINYPKRARMQEGTDALTSLRIQQSTNGIGLRFRARLSEGHTPRLELTRG